MEGEGLCMVFTRVNSWRWVGQSGAEWAAHFRDLSEAALEVFTSAGDLLLATSSFSDYFARLPNVVV